MVGQVVFHDLHKRKVAFKPILKILYGSVD